MCVSFQYYLQKERRKTKLFVILLVLWIGRVRVTGPVPAACYFCATLSFQKIKETAKEEQSYVNTNLAFAVPPRKIQKRAKQVKGDNGSLVTTFTSGCQEHSKLSTRLSLAAAMDHILNPGETSQPAPTQPNSTQTHAHAHAHPHLCGTVQSDRFQPEDCAHTSWLFLPVKMMVWGAEPVLYIFGVCLVSANTRSPGPALQLGVVQLGANPTWRDTVMALSVEKSSTQFRLKTHCPMIYVSCACCEPREVFKR